MPRANGRLVLGFRETSFRTAKQAPQSCGTEARDWKQNAVRMPATVPERVEREDLMTEVNGIGPVGAPKAIEPPANIAATERASQAEAPRDVVEISSVAKLAAKIQDIPEVRGELVQRVKSEIETGAYETPERIEIAVDKLMEELLGH